MRGYGYGQEPNGSDLYTYLRKMTIEGEEVKDQKTLAKIKTVDEMIPKPAEDQRHKWWIARIWEEQYRIIEEYLMMDATVEEACMAAWISVPSYYKHRESNPEFERRMAMAREYPKVAARAAVMKRIRLWDAKTALDYLKLRDKRYKPDAKEEVEEKAPIVQFISVASDEWNTTNHDTQNDIKQKSAYDSSASSSEAEKVTPRENEEQALRNIDSLTFSNE